jgi:hypothetical protein
MPIAKKKPSTAESIVENILDDISDRSGLSNAWDDIDAATKLEIRGAWVKIVQDEIGEEDPEEEDDDDDIEDDDSVDDDEED